jgi:hypothetical protein
MTGKQKAFVVAICLALFVQRASFAGNLPYPYSLGGTYHVEAEARDDHESAIGNPSVQDNDLTGEAPSVNNVVDYSAQPGAEIAQSNSACILTMHAQLGSFQIFTSAISNSARVTNDHPLYTVEAQARSSANLSVSDVLRINTTPGRKIINAKWTISGYLGADANGAQSADPNDSFLYDYTQSVGESWLGVSGTGITPGPIPGDNIANGNQYAEYFKQQGGKQPPPTIDHLAVDPPASVAISFELLPGQPTSVSWQFYVGAEANVENKDLTPGSGFAVATSQFSHTMTWGGITSVIDETTGQPITDWTLDSASGFDYTQAVPEPSTFVLAVLAFGVAFRRRFS